MLSTFTFSSILKVRKLKEGTSDLPRVTLWVKFLTSLKFICLNPTHAPLLQIVCVSGDRILRKIIMLGQGGLSSSLTVVIRRHMQRRSCENMGGDNHLQAKESHLRGNQPCQHLNFRLPAFRTKRQ